MRLRLLLLLHLFSLPFVSTAQPNSPSTSPDHSIALSEIMYDPPTGASSTYDEFIELYNTSETASINLNDWKITTPPTGSVTLSDTGKGETVLAPKCHAVIFSYQYFSKSHYYDPIIPPGTLILKSDKSLSLNNDGDSLIVINSQGDTVITMNYMDKTDKGYSLEKIELNGEDDMENYAPSLWLNGTPGRRNSVAPAKFDLAIKAAPEVIGSQQQVTLLPYKIINTGELSFGKGSVVRLHRDLNSNGFGEESEVIDSHMLAQDLNSTDTVQLSFSYTPQTSGSIRFIFSLTNALDENDANDTAKTTLVIRTMQTAVVINEILYEPIQDPDDFIQDQPDFIELYNRSNEPVDLHGWSISDKPNEHGEFDIYFFADDPEGNHVLNPGQYAVVSPDKASNPDSTRLVLYYPYLHGTDARLFYVKTRSTFSLNNEGDLVLLRDKTGAVVDSVMYSPDWHNEFYSSTAGKSLERLNPNFPGNDRKNWSTSTDRRFGASPGKANSIYTPSPLANQTTSLVIEPRTFSPDSDGRDDYAVISYKLSGQVNRIRVKIFDARGRIIQTLSNSLPSGASGQVIWDGRDKNGKTARMGIYLVQLEALNANDAVTTTAKNTVVLAKRLN